ncbi:hypothetical protein F5Y06DRAFT_266227 [Hypoxylon sp. FL0890]|nr:hypothetical protein F5Y06DRAFT_266227 [Hypoxylon sp. FL0890]
MCMYKEVRKYNCGHEEISANFEQSPMCLFYKNGGICGRELGLYRILEIVVNNWCPRCAPKASTIPISIGPVQPPTGPGQRISTTPHALAHELERQKMERDKLDQASYTPQRRPEDRRLEQLNGMAQQNLDTQINNKEALDATVYSWVIRYIASLAPWIDRQALVDKLAPWFAELLDEDHQICIRPTLKSMGCEHMLDNIMVWTRDVLV